MGLFFLETLFLDLKLEPPFYKCEICEEDSPSFMPLMLSPPAREL